MEPIPDPAQPRPSWGQPREACAFPARGTLAPLEYRTPQGVARAWPNLVGLLGLFLLVAGLLGLLLALLTSGIP